MMFVVTRNKDWKPGIRAAAFLNTIEEAEAWILKDSNKCVGKFLETHYVFPVEVGEGLVYKPRIVIDVVTTEEERVTTE